MSKTIIENTRQFLLVILVFLIVLVLIWMYFQPTQYDAAFTDEIVLVDQVDSYLINNHMDILPDYKGQWTLEDVAVPIRRGENDLWSHSPNLLDSHNDY